MKKITHKLINQVVLTDSRADWSLACGEKIFAVEYSALFNRLDNKIANAPIDDFYAVVEGKESNIALAILEIVSTHGKTKLLSLKLHPKYSAGMPLDQMRTIYLSAIEATYSAAPYNKVTKFYGGTLERLNFFVEIEAEVKAKGPPHGLRVQMAGRWLEFVRK